MTAKEKLIKKFFKNPESLKCAEIQKVLIYLGSIKIQAKGSHLKFKNHKLKQDIILPIHNNECKDFYKKQASKILKEIKK